MSKLDKDSVLEKFTNAYQSANGKAPDIEAKGGWYSVDGDKNVRLAQLDEMADELGASESGAAKPTAKKAATPVEKKVSAKANKPVAKKPKAKKSKGEFSVKDFYIQQIRDVNPGSKAPR
jgi:hypothetical protein